MHTLSTLFPAAFPALALSHFVALLSPGPDFSAGRLRCTLPDPRQPRTVSRHRRRQCAVYCSGHRWLGTSAPGAAAVFTHRAVGRGLLTVDWQPADSQPSAALAVESVRASRPGFGKQLLLGLGSSLLNPKNALFYLALMTSLLGQAVTLLQQTVSGLWMVSVVFFWDLLLVSAIALPQVQRRLSAIVWRVERAAGAILMLFGLWIIWRFLHDLAVRLYA